MSYNIKIDSRRKQIAGNVDPEELNEIKQDLTQKFERHIQTVTGENVISVPSNWRRFDALMRVNNQDNLCFAYSLSKGMIPNGTTYVLRGGYYVASSNNGSILLEVACATDSSLKIKTSDAVVNGSSKKSTAVLTVCYETE